MRKEGGGEGRIFLLRGPAGKHHLRRRGGSAPEPDNAVAEAVSRLRVSCTALRSRVGRDVRPALRVSCAALPVRNI